jgi:hypothetical protein
MIEEEVTLLSGRRHHPQAGKDYYRSGSAPSSVFVDGERQRMPRPRVRRKKSEGGTKEVYLKSWKLACDREEWEEAMMMSHVVRSELPWDVRVASQGPAWGKPEQPESAVKEEGSTLVDERQQGDLSTMDLQVLLIDGVVLCKELVATVALGIDTNGQKRILGFKVGASENAEACCDLLENLLKRGLKAPNDRKLLAILDGSEAVYKALMQTFPGALVQRCLVYKERNIKGYLSARHWKERSGLFKRLRNSQGKEDGAEAAQAIEEFLRERRTPRRWQVSMKKAITC